VPGDREAAAAAAALLALALVATAELAVAQRYSVDLEKNNQRRVR
jgi:hypothetical protein